MTKPALAAVLLLALAAPASAAVLTVGAGQTYATLNAAVAAASAGDTINVNSGTYTDDGALINKALTITGVNTGGGAPIFTLSVAGSLFQSKGFLVVDADTTVNNITFLGASISAGLGGNGAGIRYEAGNLIVNNSRFTSNQDGILATPNVAGTGNVTINNSVFTNNGAATCPSGGCVHALYANALASLTVAGSTFTGTMTGHDIQSRAAITTVTGSTLDDGVSGTASYAIDVNNGGVATITGNTITQGPNTKNSGIINYGGDDPPWTTNSLTVSGNLFTNTYPNGAFAILDNLAGAAVSVTCNAFIQNTGNALVQVSGSGFNAGTATVSGNVTSGGVPACAFAAAEPPGFAAPFTAALIVLGYRTYRTRNRVSRNNLAG